MPYSLPTTHHLAASVKAGYGRGYDDWLELNPGVPYTPFYLNPILAKAWADFQLVGRDIIVRAAKRCGMSPLNPNAENFQGSAVSTVYDLVSADKEAASPPPAEVSTIETASQKTVLQIKAAAPDSTLVIRTAAAEFFKTSFIKPAQDLQRELKLQKELKKQTMPLDIDRRAIPETSVGRWVTPAIVSQLQENENAKKLRLEEAKERQVENLSKKAQTHVALLQMGETVLEKLRADRTVRGHDALWPRRVAYTHTPFHSLAPYSCEDLSSPTPSVTQPSHPPLPALQRLVRR